MTRVGKAVAVAALFTLGSSASAWAGNETKQQTQLERDKIKYTDRVQQGIDRANVDIDSLAKRAEGQTGAAKDRVVHVQKAITFMRDLLNEDRDKIASATTDDWTDVRAMVDSDLSQASSEIRVAMAFVRPQTGVTNKQPNTR
jgi:hypothetical protein